MAESDLQHSIKRIRFLDRENTPIFIQNQNGPCPLLALANVLSLRNRLPVPASSTSLSTSSLTTMVAELILDADVPSVHEHKEYENHLRANIADSLNMLGKLAYGMDVNIRFNSPLGFEPTSEVAIFDLLGITLVHGWLVDPLDTQTTQALGSHSYNEVVEMVVNAQDAPAPPAAALHSTRSMEAASAADEGADAESAGASTAVGAPLTATTAAAASSDGGSPSAGGAGGPTAIAGPGVTRNASSESAAAAAEVPGTSVREAAVLSGGGGGGGGGGGEGSSLAGLDSLAAGLKSCGGAGTAAAAAAVPNLISFDDDDDEGAGVALEPVTVTAGQLGSTGHSGATDNAVASAEKAPQGAEQAPQLASEEQQANPPATPVQAPKPASKEPHTEHSSIESPPVPPAPSPPMPPPYPAIPSNPPAVDVTGDDDPSASQVAVEPVAQTAGLPQAAAEPSKHEGSMADAEADGEPLLNLQQGEAADSAAGPIQQAALGTGAVPAEATPAAAGAGGAILAEATPAAAGAGAMPVEATPAAAGGAGGAIPAAAGGAILAEAAAAAAPAAPPPVAALAAAGAMPAEATPAAAGAGAMPVEAAPAAAGGAGGAILAEAAAAAPALAGAGAMPVEATPAAAGGAILAEAAPAAAGGAGGEILAEAAPAAAAATAEASPPAPITNDVTADPSASAGGTFMSARSGGIVAEDGASTSAAFEDWVGAKEAKASTLLKDAAVARRFLEATASQLTEHGIHAIQATLPDNTLAVFFRNYHFSCMFKHEGALYLLVTDQGYMRESMVVWERLDTVDGNTQMCGPDFHSFCASEPPPRVDMSALNSIPPEALAGLSEADAAAIAEAAGGMPSMHAGHSSALVSASGPTAGHQEQADTKGDAALAAQLAREEEEAAKAAAAARPAQEQQQRQQQAALDLRAAQGSVQERQRHLQLQRVRGQQAPALPVSVRASEQHPMHMAIPPEVQAYQQKQQQPQLQQGLPCQQRQQGQAYLPPPPPAALQPPPSTMSQQQQQQQQPPHVPPASAAGTQQPQQLQYVPELNQYVLPSQLLEQQHQQRQANFERPAQSDADADLALALHLQQQEEQELAEAERRRRQQQGQQQPPRQLAALLPPQQQLAPHHQHHHQQQQRQQQQAAGRGRGAASATLTRQPPPSQEDSKCVLM